MNKQTIISLTSLAVSISIHAAQSAPQVTVIADGLNSPRGLAFAPNEALYVAEAGLGAGDGNGGFAAGVGFTASILEIKGVNTPHPKLRRVVSGLASLGSSETGSPQALGPSGVSVHGSGGIYVTMAESVLAVSDSNPNLPAAAQKQFGHVLKVTPGGQWKPIADVGDFDYLWTAANKDEPWAPAGQFPDANPYGILAGPAGEFIADAGANILDAVRPNGAVRIVAYFPNPLLPLPNGASVPVSDAVPTCVTRGPDGYLYVGTLAFGANFARFSPKSPPSWGSLPAQSKIYRVNPEAKEAFLTDADVWAADLNPIVAIGFNRGSLYVTEYTTQESGYQTGDVVQIKVNPDGTAGSRTSLGVGALSQPNGLAFDRDGAVYVSNQSVSSGGGQVVRVNY